MSFENIKNPLDDIIRNVFGSWSDLEVTVRNTMKDTEDHKDVKLGSAKFTRLVLGRCSNDLSSDEFRFCIQAVNIIIGRIKKEKSKRSREAGQLANEIRIERMKDDQEKEKERTGIDPGEYNRL